MSTLQGISEGKQGVTGAPIVERLRSYRSAGVKFARLSICDDAADRITELLEALERIEHRTHDAQGFVSREVNEIARAALSQARQP